MNNENSEYYITLQSNACNIQYPNNRFAKFRNNLPAPLQLNGDWAASLIDITIPIRYNNVQSYTIAFVAPIKTPRNSTALDMPENSCDKIMETAINNVLTAEQDSDSGFYHSADSPSSKKQKLNKYIRTCRTARLTTGYFTSINEIGESIVSLYKSTFSDLYESEEILAEPRFNYYPITNMAALHSKAIKTEEDEDDEDENDEEILPIQIFTKTKNLFQYHFGIVPERKTFPSHSNMFSVELPYLDDLRSTLSCNLKKFSKLYVCCDCIDYSSVANNVVKLLTSIPFECEKKSSMITCYPPVRYHAVRSQIIDSIEIEILSSLLIRDLFPAPINPSDTEFIECTMHFRHVNDMLSI